MGILQIIIDALAALLGPREGVRGHDRHVAHGPRWSRREPRRIDPYKRKRPRRAR